MSVTPIIVTLVLLVTVSGVLAAITPWLMRKNECFTVTVPETAQRDPRLMALKKRYTVWLLIVTVVCTVLAALSVRTIRGGDDTSFITVYMVAVLAPVVIGFVLMLVFRKKVALIKREEGWVPGPSQQVSAAEIGGAAQETPRAISMWWNLLYIPVIVVCAAVPLFFYDSMPDVIPMHMDFAGNVNSTAPKTLSLALMPALVNLFMAICFAASHASIAFSKKWMDPGSPATSAYAYGLFARAQSIMLLVGGLLLCVALGGTMVAAFLGAIDLGAAAAIIMVAALVMVAGAVVISIVYGQAGSRVFARMEDKDQLLFDDDEHWKLGIFYFNRDDSAVFLPERFGVGWTVNLARPLAWAFIIGLIVVTFAFIAIITSLV